MAVKTQESTSTETMTKRDDLGFIGYRDYKSSDFYKRYEAARAKLPENALREVPAEVSDVKIEKTGRGNAIAIAIFSCLYVVFCAVGFLFFAKKPIIEIQIDTVIKSLLGVFDGKDIITCIIGVINGSISDMIEMIGVGTLAVSVVLALLAFIGGIVDAAAGKGVGKLMKTGCTIMFFCAVVSLGIVLGARLELTIGLSVAIIIGGIVSLCTVTAPNKVKEKKQ